LTVREVQKFRVIEVLEHIAAPGPDAVVPDATRRAAVGVLRRLAEVAPDGRPAQEAKASLEWLERPGNRKP
jgi:hypothetical protein